jgi:hypothetical protein
MKGTIYFLTLMIFFSCSSNSNVINDVSEDDKVEIEYPFVDLKFFRITDDVDSIKFHIGFKDISGEIEFNNPRLNYGFPEYGINAFSIINDSMRIKVTISRHQLDTITKGMQKKPFKKFVIENCEKKFYIEKHKTEGHYEGTIIDTLANIRYKENSLIFSIKKSSLSPQSIIALKDNISINIFYNRPKENCKVTYYGDYLEKSLEKIYDKNDRGLDTSSCN